MVFKSVKRPIGNIIKGVILILFY